MTRLSVNINKLATLRNARGHNNPDLIQSAIDIERYGAHGITVHPRPDERHIRYEDVRALKKVVKGEFNIEGNCREQKFVDLVLEVLPDQVTLVPDAEGQITSNHGWDTAKHQDYLKEMIKIFSDKKIRVSIFVDPAPEMIKYAAKTGADRIELYTESYANAYKAGQGKNEVCKFIVAANLAHQSGMGINAGHDLDLNNLAFLNYSIPELNEVSIGHALICDAIYLGLENTVQLYKRCLEPGFYNVYGKSY